MYSLQMHSCQGHYFPFRVTCQLSPIGSGGLLRQKTKLKTEKTLVRGEGT